MMSMCKLRDSGQEPDWQVQRRAASHRGLAGMGKSSKGGRLRQSSDRAVAKHSNKPGWAGCGELRLRRLRSNLSSHDGRSSAGSPSSNSATTGAWPARSLPCQFKAWSGREGCRLPSIACATNDGGPRGKHARVSCIGVVVLSPSARFMLCRRDNWTSLPARKVRRKSSTRRGSAP